LNQHAGDDRSIDMKKEPPPVRRLNKAAALIRSSLHRRPRLPELAAAAGLSVFHFHRLFKRHFGETPLQMVARLQIDLAKRLLCRGVPLREIAARCGYSHQSHMTVRFRQATGTTPTRWLRDNEPSRARRTMKVVSLSLHLWYTVGALLTVI
jgi:AraC family transcriptional regulator